MGRKTSVKSNSGNDAPQIAPGLRKVAFQELGVYHECKRLLLLFFYWDDHGQAAKGAQLFTDDAVLIVSPGLGAWKGKDSISRSLMARQGHTDEGVLTIHHLHNFLVEPVSDKEAVGTAYYSVFKSVGKPGQGLPGKHVAKLEQPLSIGEFRTRFVKTDDGWRIAAHEIIYVFDANPGKDRRDAAYAKMQRFASSSDHG